MKKSQNLFCFLIVVVSNLISTQALLAADFSHAKQIYVPPSLIHRDLDALGTNNWNVPVTGNAVGTGANTGSQASPLQNTLANPIDSLLSNSSSNAPANASSTSTASGIKWGNAKDAVLAGSQYIPSINKISAQISALLSNGQVAEAENVARAGLKYYPSSTILKSKFTAITTSEAQTFLAAGYSDLSGKKAREALACNPNAKTAKIVEGKVLQSQGLNPNTAEGHVQSGDSLSADGRLLESGVEYKLALNIKPTAAAHVGLGNLALGKGLVVDAGRHYQQALSLDPQSAAAYRQRGALYYVMQDAVSANSDFSKAVALDPNDRLAGDALVSLWKQQVANNLSVNSHLGLARAYMQTHNLEAAKSEYKTVASLDPNNPALPEARRSFKMALAKQQAGENLQAAKTLAGQGAYNEAQQKIDEALILAPGDPQILLYRGQISEKLGLYEQAHGSYMSALKADPKNVEAAQKLKTLPSTSQYNGQAPQPAPVIPYSAPLQNMPSIQVIPNSPGNDPGAPNIFTAPLKSPLPLSQTKSEIIPTDSSIIMSNVYPNNYLRTGNDSYMQPHLYIESNNQYNQNFAVIDSYDQVGNLANFLCAVRALMLAEKQGFQ